MSNTPIEELTQLLCGVAGRHGADRPPSQTPQLGNSEVSGSPLVDAIPGAFTGYLNKPTCEVAMNHVTAADTANATVRGILLKLAKDQDGLAAHEAARVTYWKPCPPSVLGGRAAAAALRAQADEYLTAPVGVAS